MKKPKVNHYLTNSNISQVSTSFMIMQGTYDLFAKE